jgi:hypothetical protein
MHHIATEDKYGFPHKEDIKIRDLTDEEIEEDLIQIRKEIYPKPLVVVSYFGTRSTGKRQELINLLENLTKKMDIPFYNPSVLLEK